MSAITPVTSMPANGASPSGMLTTSSALVRVQAIITAGQADLYLIQKGEGGDWFKVPHADVLRLDASDAAKAVGQILIPNPVASTAFHVLQERSGTLTSYIAGVSSTTTVTELAATTLTVSGNGTVAGTLAVTGAATLTGGATAGAAIAMGSNKITGLAAASANGDALRYEQGGMLCSALSTGTIGASTKYMSRGAAAVAASAVVIGTVTRAGVLRRLYANLLTAPGGSDTVAFTIQKSSDNGGTWSDTTLTCTITGSAKGNSDTTHAPSVAAGDLLAVKMVSNTTTAADPSVGFEIL